jgi:phenylpropionate dioxygenase-like ring-hydroxylating dioxygenase large terminal subunit
MATAAATVARGEQGMDFWSLFDADSLAAVRRPVEDASTLPPRAYWDPKVFELEIARIFRKGWQFVGHQDRIPLPGSFAAFDFAGVPILLVHDSDGRRRAFANSCRHRGAELVSGEGSCRTIVCPYHGWTYGLDGQLVSAPGMQRVRGFRLEENGLPELPMAQIGTLMWVSFDPEAPPFNSYADELPQTLAAYGLDDLVLSRRTEYDVGCNWKVYVENFMDYYHTPIVHRETLARGNLSAYHRDLPRVERGPGDCLVLYARHQGSAALLPGAEGFPPLPSLRGLAAEGSTFLCTFPCGLIGLTKDCVWYVEVHPTGPERVRIAVGACFPRATAERPDFREKSPAYYRRWDVTVEEDNRINEAQQRGVRSPLARAGRVSPLEAASHAFRNRVLDALGAPGR